MDDKTTINDLKERIRLFCEERDWDRYHNAKDLAIGIITEAAELLEHFRFKSNEESRGAARMTPSGAAQSPRSLLTFSTSSSASHNATKLTSPTSSARSSN